MGGGRDNLLRVGAATFNVSSHIAKYVAKHKKVPTLTDLKKFIGDEAKSILNDAKTLLDDSSFTDKLNAAIRLGSGIDVQSIYKMATGNDSSSGNQIPTPKSGWREC